MRLSGYSSEPAHAKAHGVKMGRRPKLTDHQRRDGNFHKADKKATLNRGSNTQKAHFHRGGTASLDCELA